VKRKEAPLQEFLPRLKYAAGRAPDDEFVHEVVRTFEKLPGDK